MSDAVNIYGRLTNSTQDGFEKAIDENTKAFFSEAEQLRSGIKPNTVRLSIGTEHIDDIIADLDQAFRG